MEFQSPQAKTFTLYGLKRPDDNVIRYIGITSQGISRRLGQHRSDGHNPKKVTWIAEMLPLRPEIVPYSTGLTLKEVCELEIFVIKELRKLDYKLLNISDGGTLSKLGYKCSPETKRKISEGNRGHTRNVGTKRTPEACQRMSEAQRIRGRFVSVETRKNQSVAKLSQPKKSGCSSEFRGVIWNKQRKLWGAGIEVCGITLNLGCYEDEKDAAIVRDYVAKIYFGDQATLNFS